jgi:hypothetical protein
MLRILKSVGLGLNVQVTRMAKTRNAYRILEGVPLEELHSKTEEEITLIWIIVE